MYSVIARYRRLSGELSHKSMLSDLFGTGSVSATVDLPAYVGRLVERLPLTSEMTAERLIWNHTMFPFYTAFLPQDQSEAIYMSMVNGNGVDIYLRAGIMASSIRQNVFLRFCTHCFQEDIESFGEAYWHRIHQIPGLDVCVKHSIWLQDSEVRVHQENKHVFVPPDEVNCPYDTVSTKTPLELLNKYSSFSKGIEGLLTKRFPNRPLEYFQQFYRSKLHTMGYVSSKGGKVHQEKLRNDMNSFYGSDFLERLQSSVDNDVNWLTYITRKHRKSFHPLRHLLLLGFLQVDSEEVFFNKEADPTKVRINHMKITEVGRAKEQREHNGRNDQTAVDRMEWLEMQETNPELSKTELRKLNPALYTRLYRNDKSWLDMTSPEKKNRLGRIERIDWDVRDAQVLKQAQQAVEQIRDTKGRPKRITVGRIGSIIGMRGLLEKHLNKMPDTKGFLSISIEDEKGFRLRRVKWAINELIEEGEQVLKWKVLRRAGIGPENVSENILMLFESL